MTKERKIFFTDIGEVRIKKRKGSRRMSIRINSGGIVSVNIPFFVSYKEAEKFLLSKTEWVKQHQEKIEEGKRNREIFTESNVPATGYHEFIISRKALSRPSRKYSAGLCEIFFPVETEIDSPEAQAYIRACIIETYRREAKVVLVNRCRELADIHDFSIKDIKIKKMKSRWGSCSSKGNINLNLFLMALPRRLSDYVILHELVHTRHMNHSKLFWNELERILENSRQLSREMRKYGYLLTSLDD